MSARRRTVSSDQLHELLVREFRASAAGLCPGCRVPRPVFFDGARDGPNWRVPPLDECSGLCHTILADIAGRLAQGYDLAR